MREPTIHEIEKLIKHFRETEREHELHEVLELFGMKNPTEVVQPETNEFNEQGIVLQKIAAGDGLKISEHKALKNMAKKHKNSLIRYSIYYLLLFTLIFIGLNAPVIASKFFFKTNNSQIITTQELEQAKMADSAPLDPGEVIPSDSQIAIPKIGVTAPIIYPTTIDEKELQSYLPQGVVHYYGTANPGEVGNSFITGHSSNYWWIKGNYNYVFLNLDKLTVGDQAKIYRNGKKYIYAVTGTSVVDPTDTSVLAATDTPTLTLMTCTPPGTNWKRLIVKLDQVSPKYEKPQLVTKQVVAPKNLPSTDSNFGSWLAGIWEWIKKLFSAN